jgi:hypothetical protein
VEPRYVDFHYISNKQNRPVQSLYGSLSFLDSRTDTSYIGIIDSGSRKVFRAELKTPVEPQLNSVLVAHCAPNSGDGQLLFQLRRFSFAETSGSRYCYLAATLYTQRSGRYAVVANLDTVISITVPSTLMPLLRDDANSIMNEFFDRSIRLSPDLTTLYDLDQIVHIDSIEERRIPVYNTMTFREGLYSTYDAFRNQIPDVAGTVITRDDGTIRKLELNDRKWKEQKHAHIYAAVYKGVPYVVTHYACVPLEKQGNDFYFTGKLRVNVTKGEYAAENFFFGDVAGELLAEAGNKTLYRVLIDHQTGEFIHLKVLLSN